MKKIIVATREEALGLIAGGTNSMLVFSEEAPHGYKKDGTPSAPRGRKPLPEDVVAARAATKLARGNTREKTGPLVRTAEAPHGVKLDGTPMLKRGRPTREQMEARKTVTALATVTSQPVVAEAATATTVEEPEGPTEATETVTEEPMAALEPVATAEAAEPTETTTETVAA